MTALAGYVASRHPKSSLESHCRVILDGQRDYSSCEPAVESVPGAAIAVALFEQLPEDSPDSLPLVANGRFLLAADVRLDNRAEMLPDETPARLATLTDAQILLEAWSRHGESALDRIVGDYALAVFDKAQRTLTLARDETGQRPLFYAQSGEALAFASMPSGLLGDPSINRGWNLRRLADLLQSYELDSPDTYFAGVSRLLPGEVVRFADGRIQKRLYWNPLSNLRSLSFPDAVDEYRHLLDEAVKCRLRRRSGRVALHLSAGYDSSAIASSAAALEPKNQLLAFTAAPTPDFAGEVMRGRHADESKIAAITARKLGLEHRIVHSAELTLDYLRREALIYQEPVRNVVNALWEGEIEARARAEGATVLLNGMLGNVTLNAGGPVYLSEWVRQRGIRQWWPQAKAARRGHARWRGVLFASFAPFLPFQAWWVLTKFFKQAENSREPFLRGEWALSPAQFSHRAFGQPNRSSAIDRLSFIRAIDPGIFYKGALADSGLTQAEPLADRRIIEFSLGLTPDQLIHDGEPRPVAKAALKDRLPTEVLYPQLRGVQAADWEHHFTPAHANAILEEIESCATARQLLDVKAIRSAIANWPSNGGGDAAAVLQYVSQLPIALSTGVFLKETEGRWMRASAAPSGQPRPKVRTPRARRKA
jgi:asparagine synthase (glutamine-hydrolysing)